MRSPKTRLSSGAIRPLLKSWFSLTSQERFVVLIIVSLFLLGLGTRYWHLRCGPGQQSAELPASTPSSPPLR